MQPRHTHRQPQMDKKYEHANNVHVNVIFTHVRYIQYCTLILLKLCIMAISCFLQPYMQFLDNFHNALQCSALYNVALHCIILHQVHCNSFHINIHILPEWATVWHPGQALEESPKSHLTIIAAPGQDVVTGLPMASHWTACSLSLQCNHQNEPWHTPL